MKAKCPNPGITEEDIKNMVKMAEESFKKFSFEVINFKDLTFHIFDLVDEVRRLLANEIKEMKDPIMRDAQRFRFIRDFLLHRGGKEWTFFIKDDGSSFESAIDREIQDDP